MPKVATIWHAIWAFLSFMGALLPSWCSHHFSKEDLCPWIQHHVHHSSCDFRCPKLPPFGMLFEPVCLSWGPCSPHDACNSRICQGPVFLPFGFLQHSEVAAPVLAVNLLGSQYFTMQYFSCHQVLCSFNSSHCWVWTATIGVSTSPSPSPNLHGPIMLLSPRLQQSCRSCFILCLLGPNCLDLAFVVSAPASPGSHLAYLSAACPPQNFTCIYNGCAQLWTTKDCNPSRHLPLPP